MVKGEHLQRPSLYHGKRFADHDVSCQCSYDDAAQCYDMKLGSPDMACIRERRFLGACVKSINHEGHGKYWEASGTPKMSNLLSPKGPKRLKYGINSFFTGFANFPFSTLFSPGHIKVPETHEDRGIQPSTTYLSRLNAAVQPGVRFKFLSLEHFVRSS